MWGLPLNTTPQALGAALLEKYPSAQLYAVHIVPANFFTELSLVEKKNALRERLRRLNTTMISMGPPTQSRFRRVFRTLLAVPFCFCVCLPWLRRTPEEQYTRTLDSIAKIDETLASCYEQQYEAVTQLHQGLYPTVGVAFVHFSDHRSPHLVIPRSRFELPVQKVDLMLSGHAARAKAQFAGDFDGLLFIICKLSMSVLEICWRNLRTNPWWRATKRLISAFLIAMLVLFWNIPIAFLANLDSYRQLPEPVGPLFTWVFSLSSFVRGLLVSYLPTLLLTIFTSLLGPILWNFVRWESHTTRSHMLHSYFWKLFIFFFINVLVCHRPLARIPLVP